VHWRGNVVRELVPRFVDIIMAPLHGRAGDSRWVEGIEIEGAEGTWRFKTEGETRRTQVTHRNPGRGWG
jgi:hypothetical protein